MSITTARSAEERRALARVPLDDPRPWLYATARNLVLADARRSSFVTTTETGEPVGAIQAPEVLELDPGKRVLWEVIDGPEEWIGTHVSWDLAHADDYAIVLFKHAGWKEPVEFMHHCSTKWG